MSCGIYKITNKINNKCYIGQSTNIERRFNEHKRRNEQIIDKAIKKYGINNFDFEIIELCEAQQLNEKEEYWTIYYSSHKMGYNMGIVKNTNVGENNSMAKLTNEDVFVIRECYKNKVFNTCSELHKNLFNKYSYHCIYEVFYGLSWTHIYMDVYNDELDEYYYNNSRVNNFKDGEENISAILTEKEVIAIRALYTIKQQKDLYEIFDYLNERTIKSIISGQNWKHIPIYKKRTKIWIFPEKYDNISKTNFLRQVKEIIENYGI